MSTGAKRSGEIRFSMPPKPLSSNENKKDLHRPHPLHRSNPHPASSSSPGLHSMPRQHGRHPTRNPASLPPRHHPPHPPRRRPLRHHPRPLQTPPLIRIDTPSRSSKGRGEFRDPRTN